MGLILASKKILESDQVKRHRKNTDFSNRYTYWYLTALVTWLITYIPPVEGIMTRYR